MRGLAQRWRSLSLTLRTAVLFALVAALVVSGSGWYLFSAMRQEMTLRSDLQVTGRVEYFRHLLSQRFPLARLTANTGLFENMLGNEQDVLIFQHPGQQPLINVNPARLALPPITPTPADRPQTLDAMRGGETERGVPLRAASAMVRLEDGSLLQISAAHVMVNEQKMLARYLWRIVAAVAVAFLLIALLGYGVMRRGLRPLWKMAAQAAVITPNTLSTRLSEQGAPQELRQLTRSFNAMLDRLNAGYQRLTQFSADLAHEIRTPVGALMGHCQVALYQPRSVEEYETLLSNNMEELERISRMVENILFLARAGEAQSVLNCSRLDLGQELRRVADYFEGLAEERGMTLSCEGEGTLWADGMLFQRALSNLVANAVRYADENSRIRLWVGREAGATAVRVINQGPPLAAAHLDKLFDRFYRADPARSAGVHASGLGLSIVRAIMTLHGGEVSAECIAGEPSARITFSLIFPRAD
ncbi:heavy metal sensor histidine kinase [Serratia ficaria]|uniref:heavy metal sensor histidine kinase n=1 Tax=Serratia ficaria TaxID=61651 RepID=UPI00119924D6|nr:heavy metal sensor histidine kinase [Serratia ficaria]MEE4483738.1 heavy metal sensor histidine kinase [Serratia ficaria]CAI0829864.1 Probable sensor-like histidine kinase YedV [Serratia ficaria]CAI0875468.1 Probable sensor-like histidine kinase YedV [Serratia ficaria]CAI1527675.1 Probable sensor-like histidine kinase YedV [Serratia ficaria]CAI2404061.1 Probable sensor-like histidine kinase YedV [Serratia ficaria]